MTSSAESAGMNEDIMKLGLLMEILSRATEGGQQHLYRLQACTGNLDGVVREEIRRTLIEELRELMAEGKAAAQALRRLRCVADWRTGLFGLCWPPRPAPCRGSSCAHSTMETEIERLRGERAQLVGRCRPVASVRRRHRLARCGPNNACVCGSIVKGRPMGAEQADFLPAKRP